jgi:hypothetical protein
VSADSTGFERDLYEFPELPSPLSRFTDALFTQSAYANVHTTSAPAGEIRGQIRGEDREDR